MKKSVLIVLLLTLFIWLAALPQLHAAEEIRVVTGYGVTQKEAKINALLEAIQQVKGAKLQGVENLRSYFKEEFATRDGIDTSSSKMSSSQKEEIHKKIQGIIKSYELLDLAKRENGHGWEVTLRVHIPVYETPGIPPHSRRKIAVMPFRTMKSNFSIRGTQISSSEISRQFTQNLVTEVTQSRRFTVLDRDYICEYFKEKNLLLSGDTPIEEQMRLGEVLGVDYMLVGTITNARLERTAHQIKAIDRTDYRDKATFIADYRIIVMPTRQTKWADSVILTLDTNELRGLAKSSDSQVIQQALLQKAAQIIAHKAIANIYPIRIAAIQENGNLILNQGGVTISEGETVDIFTAGEKVIDPYSGESLGAVETWVATAKIERVLAKMSYAKISKGEPAQVQNGDICRRVSGHQSENNTLQKKHKKLTVPW